PVRRRSESAGRQRLSASQSIRASQDSGPETGGRPFHVQRGDTRDGARRPAEMDRHISGAVPVIARFCFAAALAVLLARPAGAEPDPALVKAAMQEATVTWYSTLIVNQIVR